MVSHNERQDLMAHWRGENAALLKRLLDAGETAEFDAALLRSLVARREPYFFFAPPDVDSRTLAIAEHLPEEAKAVMAHADAILAGYFPFSGAPGTPYSVKLPPGFSWHDNPAGEREFPSGLNRHRYWMELAMAYRFSGDARYTAELRRQFVSWTSQNPPPADFAKWREAGAPWWLLNAAIRADTWPWMYFLLLGTPEWTPEINTLFLHQIHMHGEFLAALTPPGGGNNWVVMQAQGLLNIALLFPEWEEAAAWEEQASRTLLCCFGEQFHADGGHFEQSPDYHGGCIRWFLEPFYLARLNGRDWMNATWPRLRQVCECYFQLLLPNGDTANLSDSDQTRLGVLASAAHLLGEPKWLQLDSTDARSVWLRGPEALQPGAGADCEQRPTAVAFIDSGYYVMRSGGGAGAVQAIFDCGPHGHWHGHFDLLSLALYGFGKTLLCDPGRLTYDANAEREWVRGTPSHNTISIDGENHLAFEGCENPGFAVTRWDVSDAYILVSGTHHGYAELEGAPEVGRVVWFDREGTFFVLDWGEGEAEHEYTVSFTTPGTEVAVLREGAFHTTHSEGNVAVQSLLLPGQQAALEERFWSPMYGQKLPATRFALRQRARSVIFATVVTVDAGEAIEPFFSAGLDELKVRLPGLATALAGAGLERYLERLDSG